MTGTGRQRQVGRSRTCCSGLAPARERHDAARRRALRTALPARGRSAAASSSARATRRRQRGGRGGSISPATSRCPSCACTPTLAWLDRRRERASGRAADRAARHRLPLVGGRDVDALRRQPAEGDGGRAGWPSPRGCCCCSTSRFQGVDSPGPARHRRPAARGRPASARRWCSSPRSMRRSRSPIASWCWPSTASSAITSTATSTSSVCSPRSSPPATVRGIEARTSARRTPRSRLARRRTPGRRSSRRETSRRRPRSNAATGTDLSS